MALWQTPGEEDNQLSARRQKLLLACLFAAKGWLDTLQTLSMVEYMVFPFSFASQCTRCLGIMVHLSTLEAEGWDKDYVRSQVDILQVIDGMVAGLETEIAASQVPIAEESVFTRHCNFWKSLKPNLLAKLQPPLTNATPGLPTDGIASAEDLPDFLNWNYFDNEWLNSLNWLSTTEQQQGI